MNKQYKTTGSKKTNTKIEWTDYTWNPIGGCEHRCRWTMPDGSLAVCYAETTAATVYRQSGGVFYSQGFEHHYWHPDRLKEPLSVKTPAKIFLDSMSDLMGAWVPDEQIQQVLDICRRAEHHTFQLLTKNAPRLAKFDFPPNVWVGVSVPPTHMMGKQLSPQQQEKMLHRSLAVLDSLQDVPVRWMSIEPLSWDIAPILVEYPHVLEWVVVGAASNGRKTYQPERIWVEHLLTVLDRFGIPVFFKGNLNWTPWREAFPLTSVVAEQVK